MKQKIKNFFRNFFIYFFDTPVFPSLVIICSVFMLAVTADEPVRAKHAYQMSALQYARSTSVPVSSAESFSELIPESVTTSATEIQIYDIVPYYTEEVTEFITATAVPETSTACVTSAVSTTTAATEYQPPVYDYNSLVSTFSPNYYYYLDRMVVVGDSIASGFNVCGYIPYEHNLAQESMAIWNMDNYGFDIGGGYMGVLDAAAYAYSSLYYISVGMNDIFGMTPDEYAWEMRSIVEYIQACVPTATIVVGAITPVSANNYYTTNDVLIQFNNALEWVLNDMADSHVIYFNANDVLCDHSTMTLSWEFAGEDGLHLNAGAYSHLLNCLFNYLDMTPAAEQIQKHEENLWANWW
ncbi:MAG: SGNH/GDSL hydrolase family protein [Ruminococcus sp.]|nr:SGNH/GDSL hydrolase family protein [Ruminococcus sp.]MDE6784876.1 SGNH/GDSL hydrolase family protein [Ruminococcus sp.]